MDFSINIISLIAFSIYLVSLFALIIVNLKQRKSRAALVSEMMQLVIDKAALIEKIEKLNLEASKEANDGFVRFLSQSRDWAFNYIEEVQEAIHNYQVSLDGSDPIVAIEARKRLFDLLPETTNK